MSDFVTAFVATLPIWGFIVLMAGIAGLFLWAEYRADREWEDVETNPAKVAAARDELNAATLAHIASLDEWQDDPRFRADIAKKRRQESGRRQMRDVWERPFGGDHDAA